MAKIRFKAKIRDAGNATVITIPAQYIKDGLLWQGEIMNITVETPEED